MASLSGNNPTITQHDGNPTRSYFSNKKDSEIYFLKQQLLSVQMNRMNFVENRAILKKVIYFMTIGVDVSCFFSDMVMVSSTDDLIQKKMIYWYLTVYSERNIDLSLLVINTLLKDIQDNDPYLRCLALRTLCSLKSSLVIEHIEKIIYQFLFDPNSYVRRNAIMATLRLFHINPSVVIGDHKSLCSMNYEELNALYCLSNEDLNSGYQTYSLPQILYIMMSDIEPQVVINAIHVLNEIYAKEGGIPLTRSICTSLLNRIKQFSQWGKTTILNLLCNYKPVNEDDLYDIFNILEELIPYNSSNVILSVTNSFLTYNLHNTKLHLDLLKRMKLPYLTLITTSTSDIRYIILRHLYYIFIKYDYLAKTEMSSDNTLASELLGDDYKVFFCLISDPTYTKMVKLDFLKLLISQKNVGSILDEIIEYIITDDNVTIVKKCCECIEYIGSKHQNLLSLITDQLIDCVSIGSSIITEHIIYLFQSLLRLNKQLSTKILLLFSGHYSFLTEVNCLIPSLWIIGEFSETLENSPTLIKNAIELIKTTPSLLENEDLILELLTASVKTFINHPEFLIVTLGQLITQAITDESVSFLVKDRAIWLYKLLYTTKCSNDAYVLRKLLFTTDSEQLIKMIPGIHNTLYRDHSDIFTYNEYQFDSLSLLCNLPENKFTTLNPKISVYGQFKYEIEIPKDDDKNDCIKVYYPRVMALSSKDSEDGTLLPSSESNLLCSDNIIPSMNDINSNNSDFDMYFEYNVPCISLCSFHLIWSKLENCHTGVISISTNSVVNSSDIDTISGRKENILSTIKEVLTNINVVIINLTSEASGISTFDCHGTLINDNMKYNLLMQLVMHLVDDDPKAYFTLKCTDIPYPTIFNANRVYKIIYYIASNESLKNIFTDLDSLVITESK